MQQTLVQIADAINDTGVDNFDASRIQQIVDSVAGARRLRLDDGGGLHDASETRVGAIRRAPSGEWIIDGQNVDAARADAPIPAAKREQDEPGDDDDDKQR
ncbi:MAG TPA: hypothetical protein VGF93_22880 [Solirubrobacteraceae bacterium]|jgi:hypothetical protein